MQVSMALVAACALSGVIATPAVAAAPAQSCAKVTGTATFAPGLSNTPKNNTVTAKGTETSCTPSAATGGSGTLTATIKLSLGSCNKLSTGGQKLVGTAASTWKNKKVSKYSLTFTTGSGAAITTATISGTVSSGLFAGKKIAGQVKFKIVGAPDCSAAKPIKSVTFTNSKPFVIS
jgi:hypothetical protein